jgi:hypothetical protein
LFISGSQLAPSDDGVVPGTASSESANDDGEKGEKIQYYLLPIALLVVGVSLPISSFLYVSLCDSSPEPLPPFFVVSCLVGVACLVCSGYLIVQRFMNRAQLRLKRVYQGFELAREHGLASAFQGRIISGDETRIPRRTEVGREFRAVGAGCFSGPQSGEPEETNPQAYTPQNDRQRQGLERYLVPRPCLGQVVRVGVQSLFLSSFHHLPKVTNADSTPLTTHNSWQVFALNLIF